MPLIKKNKRPYRQVARAKATEERRISIIGVARDLIIEKGYRVMKVEDVALQAGLARASVFRIFKHKAELLRAVEADAAERAGVLNLVSALHRLSPLEALLAAIRKGSKVWSAEYRIFHEFYGTAPFDEILRPIVKEKEGLRRQLVGHLVNRLDEAGLLLKETKNVDMVADAIWVLTSFNVFELLTRSLGYSVNSATKLIETTIMNGYINKNIKKKAKDKSAS